MARATMYHEHLEQYLLFKLRSIGVLDVQGVKVRRIDCTDGGCNWEVETVQPTLPPGLSDQFAREILDPMRAAVALMD